MPKYDLVRVDSNAYSIMGYVQRAMKTEHCSKEEIDAYLKDAKSSDYNHLLITSIEIIEKLNFKRLIEGKDEEYE